MKYTNALIEESSPYLLQHAHNPVNWVAWSEEAFEQAKRENKMVLVSIGYSACHWCHVMERNCFEDQEVAELMNKYFINIKVDREERPDVDQVYMTAVQLMTQRGGWPLNCFTLPDGRPVYGGTYFPKDQWMHILKSLQRTFETDLPKVLEYAEHLHEGIVSSETIIQRPAFTSFKEEKAHELVMRWKQSFDDREGGTNHSPKFPLPSNYSFLLHYGSLYKNERILKHVELTLDKMAMGGIYDQIGGGFARYSVDVLWKVPHFEKMLYDNGQLLSLYSKAHKFFGKDLYKHIVYQTFDWLEREMNHESGAYFAALDADSEGEEGKFYCWTKEELEKLLGKDYQWVADYYNINQRGYWEEDKYILLRSESDQSFCRKTGWSEEELRNQVLRINDILLSERKYRIRPGLDDKRITSWNAMTLEGLADAYEAFGEIEFLHRARKIARWLKDVQWSRDEGLARVVNKNGRRISGFLEDYAQTISAFIALYRATFESEYLLFAKTLLENAQKRFQHKESRMFYFTSTDTELIARKMELHDNVIASGNSVMARNLFYLGHYFDRDVWKEDAQAMLLSIYDGMETYGSGFSNWAELLLHFVSPFYELALVGEDIEDKKEEIHRHYLPNTLVAGGIQKEIPFLNDKKSSEKGTISLCFEGTCLLPTENLQEVFSKLGRS